MIGIKRLAIAALVALLLALGMAGSALADPGGKPNPTTTLVCETGEYTVYGFARGTALHIVDSTMNYVPVYASVISEDPPRVLFSVEAQRTRADIVQCTAVSPIQNSSGGYNILYFEGYFTPRG